MKDSGEKATMNINIKYLVHTSLILGGLLVGNAASSVALAAYCTVVGSPRTTTFGALTVQRDAPVGTLLAESVIPVSQVWNCSSAVGVKYGQDTGVKIYDSTYNSIQDGMRVYSTSVTGIGYALSVTAPAYCGGHWLNITSDSNYITGCYLSGIFNSGYVSQGYRIRLYKTGPVSSGMITSQRIGAGITRIANIWDNEDPININNFNITSFACSLTSTSINVPLGDIFATKFTGIASTAGDKSFDLGLSCDKDARINVSLAGTQNADTAETSVLALTSAGQTGTASGVQLLYGGTPLKISNNILLKTSLGGQESLPFTARYFQTKAAVGAGLANSSATLNITYQ